MMLDRARILKTLGILLTLLGLLVGASYAQGPETNNHALGHSLAQPQPGVDIRCENGAPSPAHKLELMEIPEPTKTPPKQLKDSAIANLGEIPEPQDPWLLDRVTKAIEHINKSLQPDLWHTDSSLTKKGKKVFDEEKKAVKELVKILDKANVYQTVTYTTTSLAIDGLITADQVLASTAIEQAIANAEEAGCYDEGNDDAECQKILRGIARAEEEMDKAKEEIDKGKYDKAIDHYKKAWDHAQDDEHTFYGFVESMPHPDTEGPFIGIWEVCTSLGYTGCIEFEATADTEFKEKKDRLLEVGAYVEVKYYVSGGISYATQIETKKSHVSGQVIAHLKPETDVAGIHNDYNALTLGRLLDRVYLLSLQPGTNEQDTADNMRNDARIEYAEPNLLSEAPEADGYEIGAWAGYDPAPGLDQYANEHLDLPLARELSTGSSVVVAILDTGVQLDHPALAPHLVAGYDFIDDDTVPTDEGNGLDDDDDELIDEAVGHGTHVAGIVRLVAPESQIMPLRVLNSDGVGSVFDVAEAMIYATDQGAQVLNLSLGTSLQSGVLQEAADYARSAGVMIVAAAGNLNSTEPQYPAADEGVIAVAAVDEQRLKTSFSNYGSWVDLSAPGESIYSNFPVDGYGWWSGTSMATPFVSGQIALLRSLAPSLTLVQMQGQIMDKVQNLDELNPDYAGQLGAGEPDVAASLGCHWADVEPDATHDLLNNTCDDDVDIADIMVEAVQWDQPQPPGSVYDNDHDGDVDIVDIMRVAGWWNWTRQ